MMQLRPGGGLSASLRRVGVLVLCVGASVALLVGLILIAGQSLKLGALLHSLFHGNLRALRLQLRTEGAWAAIALIVLVLTHTVLPFPAELLEAAGGFSLGVAVAVPLLLASFLLSAVLGYLIGLWLGRPFATALVGSRQLLKAEGVVERAGTRGLLVIRLFPLMPFSPLCIACGLARVPLRRYLWTTAMGMLPELVLVVIIGSRLQAFSLEDPQVWAPLIGVILLVLLGPTVMRRRGPKDS
jgi:uncharacterized membrane protein YdjX (TVP38/TMEM64 family)